MTYDLSYIDPKAPPWEQLRHYRELRGLSHRDLGALVGKAGMEIQNFETQFSTLYYEDAEKLASTLKIDTTLLLDDYTRFTATGYGERIRTIRKTLGMPQSKFAECLGVNRATISIWEVEYKNHRPSREQYRKLMKCYEKGGHSANDP